MSAIAHGIVVRVESISDDWRDIDKVEVRYNDSDGNAQLYAATLINSSLKWGDRVGVRLGTHWPNKGITYLVSLS